MAASSYRFVSPGVQVQEIDNSIRTSDSQQTGPTVIGRFEKGPAMRPVYVNSFSQFVQTFGNPIAGNDGTDVWRDGNYVGPTYAAYAAQAWLRNTPALNVIRLVGTEHPNHTNADGAKAGWATANSFATGTAGGGAYGLFVMPSASAGTAVTGTLAAIWYVQSGSVQLKDLTDSTQGTNLVARSVTGGSTGEFRAVITGPNGTYESNFNFDPASDKYIRKVFNTNPILTNARITSTANLEDYWLGETFERNLVDVFTNQSTPYTLSSADCYGLITALKGTQYSLDNHHKPARSAKTGWVVAQDLTNNAASFNPASQQKLFRLSTLDAGEYEQKNYKVSIGDIKAPTNDFDDYGTFSVFVRMSSDKDSTIKLVESWTGLNLNPASPNYIARRIGDKYVEWDSTQLRLREYGTYANASKYIRVEMNDDVDAGNVDPTFLPFGFFGPPKFPSFRITSGSSPTTNAPVTGGYGGSYNTAFFNYTAVDITASLTFPSLPLVVSASSAGLGDPRDAYFGISTGISSTNNEFTKGYYDLVGAQVYDHDAVVGTYLVDSFVFSLDDVSGSTATGVGAVYVSGSRTAGTSLTAVSGGYRGVLNAGYNGFTMPLSNGFDGFDVTEAEPLNNYTLSQGTPTETTDYIYNTYKRAIDTCADPETLVTDIIAVPGLTNTSLTSHLVRTCEARADALAIIDLPNVYTPESEQYYSNKSSRYGTVSDAVNGMRQRGLNSSYGATYYPWVQISDTVNNRVLFVPPSVVALGAMSYGQATQELWFAPAGFTRGGLTEGRGGVPVIGVTDRLSSKDRDALYEANINPIAQFPAEGIVIFGQKTLQVTPSALDRINVRRMMIFVKREISKIASTLLFDQNVDVTWARFTGQVNPFLATVKSRLGLTDYRVILDKTTTTPDLVDRNIMYAKIFLKPARAIEFIAIDFTITDSGASFVE